MDPQTKKEIIAEISSTVAKTIEQAVRESLKRTLPHVLLDKTTNETIKQIDIKIFEQHKFLKNLMMISIPLKKDTSRDAKKNWRDVKVLILKPAMIADNKEDGWELEECYLSGNLASDLEYKKQLNKTRKEVAFD